jgi:hypothetical protein
VSQSEFSEIPLVFAFASQPKTGCARISFYAIRSELPASVEKSGAQDSKTNVVLANRAIDSLPWSLMAATKSDIAAHTTAMGLSGPG